ncbi:N-acetyltransferase ESCO1-like isoform X2 [Montipora capricornis]|uniref:N-acetyltransferase ESCO1-like isoform X2 n=1 Tax=Montipora capricornis TaxID=246305 RepID=UPI0035F14C56
MAQKVNVMLTHGDLLTDIDCNFNNKMKTVGVDCHSLKKVYSSGQNIICSGDFKEEDGSLEVNDVESPSNGFMPANFYSLRKQRLTPKVKLFTLDAQEVLRKEDDIIAKNSTRVKRKCKKQGNSSEGKKKQKTGTCNTGRQLTQSGNQKHGKTEMCIDLLEKKYMCNEPFISDVKIIDENKYICGMENIGVQGISEESICSSTLQSGSEEHVKPVDGCSSQGSEESLLLNSEKAESVSSGTSLCSGPGPASAGLILEKYGNDYLFANFTDSDDNNPYIEKSDSHEIMGNVHAESVHFTNVTDESPSSLSFSSSSPNTSENGNTLKLLERGTDSSSAKSSPECQVPITKYFRSTTGCRSKARSADNGISSYRMSSTEKSEMRNRKQRGKWNYTVEHHRLSPPRRKKPGKKQEQMYLDLGQKDFGHVTCPTCGMVYTKAQPEDEAAHIRHHKSFVSGLRFTGWKNECVAKEYHDGRVIMVGPDAHPLHLRKIEEVRKVVDSELGFVADAPSGKTEAKTFLFISVRKVVGCAVAVQIDQGYPVLPSPGESSTPEKQIAAWCCSTTPQLAQCGISRIWVHSQHRRKKVATRLLDCVRMNFIYGCVIPRELVAFSDPTPDGKRLAKSYTGTAQFLVFR